MKKKNYVQPRAEVVVLGQTDMFCASQFTSIPNQNESYGEVVETSGWY